MELEARTRDKMDSAAYSFVLVAFLPLVAYLFAS